MPQLVTCLRKRSVSSVLIAGMCIMLACCSLSEHVRPQWVWVETYVSPVVDHQGYATDGAWHYTFDTDAIRKRDSSWFVVAETTTPGFGVGPGAAGSYIHVGDGTYYNGKLYAPIERMTGICTNVSNQSIGVFDAITLNRSEVHNISTIGTEAGGVAVAPDLGANGTIFVISFCDSNHIYAYDVETFEPLPTIDLSSPLVNMQGIAYRNGMLYVVTDTPDAINLVSPSGHVQGVIFATESDEAEGIDYSEAEIRWVYCMNRQCRVHYLERVP